MRDRELRALGRRADVDDDPIATHRLLTERSRVEGPVVWLGLLADRATWNATTEPAQDQAARVVAERLGRAWEFLGMRVWECENKRTAPRCSFCDDTGIMGDHLGAVPCGCRSTRPRPLTIFHRLAAFRHVDTGINLNLLPGTTIGAEITDRKRSRESRAAAKERITAQFQRRFGFAPTRWAPSYPAITVFGEHRIAPFLIGRWPVTNEQYWAPRDDIADPEGPVTRVEHATARRWCHGDGNYVEGNGFRLPSRIEWEYACLAGASSRFFWGDSANAGNKFCWLYENSAFRCGSQCRAVECSHRPLSPALHEQQGRWNAFGLVDMIGNVSEFLDTGEIIGLNYTHTPRDLESLGLFAAASHEDGGPNIGFRVVRSLPGLEASP